MLSVYPALFYQEENGISVVFPDLNHLSTCGDDMQEAMEMAVDCLAGYLFSEKLSGLWMTTGISTIFLLSVIF